MLARHASPTLLHTSISVSRGKAMKILCITRSTNNNTRSSFLFQHLWRSQSSSSTFAMERNAKIKFSAGADETLLTNTLEELLGAAGNGGRWALIPSGHGLERSFKFKNFTKTWVYNTTYIRWTTHNPEGLSAKDVELARICDGLARDFGEVVEDSTTTKAVPGQHETNESCGLRQVADRVVGDAGDCCTPKKK
ncbi:transcriptional coactivator/pterin dehydratase [Xylariaceae sp. FL1651]|nr:transcriptional coactivator/pterin dehydratase [Xylariaceae sp. FL1651]